MYIGNLRAGSHCRKGYFLKASRWMQGGLSERVAGLHLMAISHKRTTFESFAAYFPLVLAEKKAAGSAHRLNNPVQEIPTYFPSPSVKHSRLVSRTTTPSVAMLHAWQLQIAYLFWTSADKAHSYLCPCYCMALIYLDSSPWQLYISSKTSHFGGLSTVVPFFVVFPPFVLSD